MSKVRIIKKNDEYTLEYQVGDICEVTGTWYGGVHIIGKSGVPVSLDKEEYVELDTEPEIKEEIVEKEIFVWEILCSTLKESGCHGRLRNIYIKCLRLHTIRRQEKSL